MPESVVIGTEQVLAHFDIIGALKQQAISEAVGATADIIVESAKANHDAGAHAIGRYENQTTLLTNSMHMRMFQDTIGIGAMVVGNREYAADVELGTDRSKPYPYMYPALVENINTFRRNLMAAIS
jgi:hypothetical protein